MRAVIYCRVSTKEQTQNLSLPTQRKACLEYCQRENIESDMVFVDEGESAKTAARPEFQRMLTYCQKNRGKIGYVIVYSLNRFSRNAHDHHAIKAGLAALGISIRSVTEPIDNSSTGQLMETILAGFAQFDNDVKSERTKAGMKAAMEKGRWPYVAPLGYLNDGAPKGQSSIIPDPDRAPLIKQAYELYATGLYTRPQVLKEITTLGLTTRKGKKLSLQTFEKTLRNRLYTGWIQSKTLEKPQPGLFTPIIDQKLFDTVQAVLNGKRLSVTSYQRNNPDFPLRQFTKCSSCGRSITGSWSRGRTKKYPYYRCPNTKCKSVNTGKSKLEEAFVGFLKQLTPDEKYVRLFKAIVLDRWRNLEAETVARSRSLQKQVDELKTKREDLEEAFIYEKRISKDTYDDHLAKLSKKLILAELEAHDAKLEAFDIEAAVSFAGHLILDAERMWLEASLDQKQRFQKILFPKGVTFDGEKFGTAETCIFFKWLQISAVPKSKVASSTGFEPVLLE